MSKLPIIVKCEGNESKSIDELIALQGELKVLSDPNYSRLKNRILEFGFLEPITIWRDRNEILNGHQRVTTLKRMRDEGYEIPAIPVNSVSVKDKAEAKRIILSLTSQYGVMTEGSLAEFIREAELDVEAVIEDFAFAGIDEDLLEGAFSSLGIDTSYAETFDEQADKFEEVIGKVTEKKKLLLLYVEFEDEADFDFVQELLCDTKVQRMNREKVLEVVNSYAELMQSKQGGGTVS